MVSTQPRKPGLKDITNFSSGQGNLADGTFNPLPSKCGSVKEAHAEDVICQAPCPRRRSPSPLAFAEPTDEYAGDILLREFRRELRFLPCQDFLDRQVELNGRMRSILVSWLVRVHAEHNLHRRTLFLAIGVADRYLSKRQVERHQFQLVGACALLIAAKVEEIEPPEVRTLVHLAAGEFSQDDLKKMERRMLHTLDYGVTVPTVSEFLPHFQAASRAAQCLETSRPPMPALVPLVWRSGVPSADSERRDELSWRLAEMALSEDRMSLYPPSCLAASALLLSSRLCDQRPTWPDVTEELSGYSKAALAPCVADLQSIHSASLQPSHCRFNGGSSRA